MKPFLHKLLALPWKTLKIIFQIHVHHNNSNKLRLRWAKLTPRFANLATDPTALPFTYYKYHFGLHPIRLSSFQVILLWSCHPVKLSSCELVFLLGCLPLRLFSYEVFFLWCCLHVRSSNYEVAFYVKSSFIYNQPYNDLLCRSSLNIKFQYFPREGWVWVVWWNWN